MDRPPRIFVEKTNIRKNQVFIDDDQVLHISKSLRLHPGDSIIVFDGEGFKAKAKLELISKKQVIANIVEELDLTPGYNNIIAIQSLLKGKKEDEIVRKLTSLGASDIIFVETRYSQVKASEIRKNRIERWKKISIDECKQCERDVLPNIYEPIEIDKLVRVEADIKLVATVKGNPQNFKTKLKDINSDNKIAYIIGPEGDFDQDELKFLNEIGFESVLIHQNILRSELAAQYFCSVLSYLSY